ncbi:hypothetical protein CPC16_004421, partial [Podila verticillata]
MSGMLENYEEYQYALEAISKAQAYSIKHSLNVDAPQMVIIGEQSSGKSAALESITGLPFPQGTGTCTGSPIKVNLRRTETSEQEDLLTAYIEGKSDFNRRHMNDHKDDFLSVIADARTSQGLNEETKISQEVLEITLYGTRLVPLTIVDMPGLIAIPQDLRKAIEKMNRKFIEQPNTIILAIAPAFTDWENSNAQRLAMDADPSGKRTITIVTNADQKDKEELRDKWINKIREMSETNEKAYLVMSNKNVDDNRRPLSWEESRDQERELFDSDPWSDIDPRYKGREAVTMFLGRRLYNHTCRLLPTLKTDMWSKIFEHQKKLDDMGTAIRNPDEALEIIPPGVRKLSGDLKDYLMANYHRCHPKSDKIQAACDKYHRRTPRQDKVVAKRDGASEYASGRLSKLYEEYLIEMLSVWKPLKISDVLPFVEEFQASHVLPSMVEQLILQNIIRQLFLNEWQAIAEKHMLIMQHHLAESIREHIALKAQSKMANLAVAIYREFANDQIEKILQQIGLIFDYESDLLGLNLDVLERSFESNGQMFATWRYKSASNSQGRIPSIGDQRLSRDGDMSFTEPRSSQPYGTPERTPTTSPEPAESIQNMSDSRPHFSENGGDPVSDPSLRRQRKRKEQRQAEIQEQQQQQQWLVSRSFDERLAAKLVPA